VKRQERSRAGAALARHADHVRGNARKSLRPRFTGCVEFLAAIYFRQRPKCRQLPGAVQSSSHVESPQDLPRIDPVGLPNMRAPGQSVNEGQAKGAV